MVCRASAGRMYDPSVFAFAKVSVHSAPLGPRVPLRDPSPKIGGWWWWEMVTLKAGVQVSHAHA